MKKILILGSKGMLGQELVRAFSDKNSYELVAWDKDDIDATDFVQLQERVIQEWPDVIFNAIAYNAVDACEDDDAEYEKARILNTELPGELVEITKGLDSILVHYSTDYVFNGKKDPEDGGYIENDAPDPISHYGKTKYEGELAVEAKGKKYYIVRLSKLFGSPARGEGAKRSFFDVMLEKGRELDTVQVVDGEKSNFTYAVDLALASKELSDSSAEFGIYHFVNEDAVTWFEACQELYDITGLKTKIEPVLPDTFPRPAQRPGYSSLENNKFHKLRSFREALQEYLNDK